MLLQDIYALLQIHILFSFHTLIYYLVKLMQIYGILLNIRGKSENFGENRGIFEENARKIK